MNKVKRYFSLAFLCYSIVMLASCVNGNTLKSSLNYEKIVLSMPAGAEYIDTVGNTIIGVQNGAIILIEKDEGTTSKISDRNHVENRDGLLNCWSGSGEDQYYHIGGVSISPNQLVPLGTDWQATDSLNAFKSDDGLYGYVNKQGFKTIKPQFMFGGKFAEGLAYVASRDGSSNGILNMDGEYAPLCLQNGDGRDSVFSDGRFLLESYGDERHPTVSTYITKENTILCKSMSSATTYSIGYPFFCAEEFKEGLAAVQRGEYWGYIDINGDFAIEPQYKRAYSFSDESAVVLFLDTSFGRVDRTGKTLHTLPNIFGFDVQGEYHDGQYLVLGENGYNLVNEDGTLALSQNWATIFWEDPFWYLIDEKMNTFCYTKGLETPQATLGLIEKSKIYLDTVVLGISEQSLINYKTGNVLVTSKHIGSWGEQLLPVADERGKIGYVGVTGEFMIEPQFDSAESFKSGIAYISRNGERGFIANPLLYKNGWEADELMRADALEISAPSSQLSISIREFVNMVDIGVKRLNEFGFIEDISDAESLAATEDSSLRWRDACVILGRYLEKSGHYTERLYVPDSLSNDLSQKEKDALGLLASMGVLKFNEFHSDISMTCNEARSLVLKFCETIIE